VKFGQMSKNLEKDLRANANHNNNITFEDSFLNRFGKIASPKSDSKNEKFAPHVYFNGKQVKSSMQQPDQRMNNAKNFKENPSSLDKSFSSVALQTLKSLSKIKINVLNKAKDNFLRRNEWATKKTELDTPITGKYKIAEENLNFFDSDKRQKNHNIKSYKFDTYHDQNLSSSSSKLDETFNTTLQEVGFEFLDSILNKVEGISTRSDDTKQIKVMPNVYLFDSEEKNLLKLKTTANAVNNFESVLGEQFSDEALRTLKKRSKINFTLVDKYGSKESKNDKEWYHNNKSSPYDKFAPANINNNNNKQVAVYKKDFDEYESLRNTKNLLSEAKESFLRRNDWAKPSENQNFDDYLQEFNIGSQHLHDPKTNNNQYCSTVSLRNLNETLNTTLQEPGFEFLDSILNKVDRISNQYNEVKLVPNVYLFDSEDKNLLQLKTTLNDGEKFEKLLGQQFSDDALHELKTRSKINFSFFDTGRSKFDDDAYQNNNYTNYNTNKKPLAIEGAQLEFNSKPIQPPINESYYSTFANNQSDDYIFENNTGDYNINSRYKTHDMKSSPGQYCSTVSLRNLNETLNTTLQEPGFEFLDSILNKVDRISNQYNDVKLVPNVYLFDSEDKNLLQLKTTLNDGEKFEKLLGQQFSDETLQELKNRSKINFTMFNNGHKNFDDTSYNRNKYPNDFNKKTPLALENSQFETSKSRNFQSFKSGQPTYVSSEKLAKAQAQFCSTVSIRNPNDSVATMNNGFDFLNNILNKIDRATNSEADSGEVKLIPNVYLYDSDENKTLKLKSTLKNGNGLEKQLNKQFPQEALQTLKNSNHISFKVVDNTKNSTNSQNHKNDLNYKDLTYEDFKTTLAIKSSPVNHENRKAICDSNRDHLSTQNCHKQSSKNVVNQKLKSPIEACSTISIRNPNDSVATMQNKGFLNDILNEVNKATLNEDSDVKVLPSVYLFDSEERDLLRLKSTLNNGLEKTLNQQFPREALQALKSSNHVNFSLVNNGNVNNCSFQPPRTVYNPSWNYYNMNSWVSDELKDSRVQKSVKKPLAIMGPNEKSEVKTVKFNENLDCLGMQQVLKKAPLLSNEFKSKPRLAIAGVETNKNLADTASKKVIISPMKKEEINEKVIIVQKMANTTKNDELVQKSVSYENRPSSQFIPENPTKSEFLKRSLTDDVNKVTNLKKMFSQENNSVVKKVNFGTSEAIKADSDQLSNLQSKYYGKKITDTTSIPTKQLKHEKSTKSKKIPEYTFDDLIKVDNDLTREKDKFLLKIYSKEFIRKQITLKKNSIFKVGNVSPLSKVNQEAIVSYNRPTCYSYKTVSLCNRSTLFKKIHPMPKKSSEFKKLVDEFAELHKLGMFKNNLKRLAPKLDDLIQTDEQQLNMYMNQLSQLRKTSGEEKTLIQASKSCGNVEKNKTPTNLVTTLKENFSDSSMKPNLKTIKKINEYHPNSSPNNVKALVKKHEISLTNQTPVIKVEDKIQSMPSKLPVKTPSCEQLKVKAKAPIEMSTALCLNPIVSEKLLENKKILPILELTELPQDIKRNELNKLIETYLKDKQANSIGKNVTNINLPKVILNTKDKILNGKESFYLDGDKNFNLINFALQEKNVHVDETLSSSKQSRLVTNHTVSLFIKEFKLPSKKRTLWMLIMDEIVESIYGIQVFLRFERPKPCPFELSLNIRGSKSLLTRNGSMSSQMNFKEISFLSESIVENLNESVYINGNSPPNESLYEKLARTIENGSKYSNLSNTNNDLSINWTDFDLFSVNSAVEVEELRKLKDIPLGDSISSFKENLNDERLQTFIQNVQKAGIKTVDDYFEKSNEEISPEKMIELKYKLMEDIKSKIKSHFQSNTRNLVSQSNMELSIKVGVKIVKTGNNSFKSIFFLTQANENGASASLNKSDFDSWAILKNKQNPKIEGIANENLINFE
jgi:hypothetical protein